MREGDEGFEALKDAVEAFGSGRAPDLVAEAQAEAITKARSMLAEAMAQSLIEHAAAHLAPATQRPRESGSSEQARSVSPSRREPGRHAPETGDASAYYVYGIGWAEEASLPAGLAGVDPRHDATVVEAEGLAAVTSRVSLVEFGEEQLRENLNDVAWLEEKARAHEHVLDQALSRMTVVPMRLCTIYRGEEQVREMLVRERDLMADALHRLEGRKEWGVKMIAEPGALERAVSASSDTRGEKPAEVSPGAAYMREKGRDARARTEADRIAARWAESVHEPVAARATEALLNPLQNPEVSGHVGEMLLNGVYLVEDGQIDMFRRTVEELAAEYGELGVDVELTGPWPPYNFVKSSIEAAR